MEFLLGLVVFVLDVWAIIHVIGSRSSTLAKVLWVLLILVMPVLGFLIWLVAGPRRTASMAT